MTSIRSSALVFRICSACAFLLLAQAIGAQTPEGALVGTVTDTAGARVAGAIVSAESLTTHIKRSVTSNSRGEFRLESLQPSNYRVTVAASGFAPFASELKIEVSSAPTLSVVL